MTKKLREILYNLSDPEVWIKQLIEWGFKRITPEKLENVIQTNYNPLLIAFNHFHLADPIIASLARILLKMYWDVVEEYLTDANKIREILASKPELSPIINTPTGIDYLNRVTPMCYDFMYDWTYQIVKPSQP